LAAQYLVSFLFPSLSWVPPTLPACLAHRPTSSASHHLALFPSVQLDAVIGTLTDRLKTMQKQAADWKAKYNIRTQEEVEAQQRRQQQAQA